LFIAFHLFCADYSLPFYFVIQKMDLKSRINRNADAFSARMNPDKNKSKSKSKYDSESSSEDEIKTIKDKRKIKIKHKKSVPVTSYNAGQPLRNINNENLFAQRLPGLPGRDGINGKDGQPGLPGSMGPAGTPGRDGIDGKNGRDGINGQPGPAGPQGIPGRDGKDGQPGPMGPQGIPGVNGKDGQPGLQGIPGRDGINGKDGQPGSAGAQGISGRDGIDGKNGINGRDGIDGKNGRDGIDGKDGANGLPGAPGLAGPQGIPGIDGKDGLQGPMGLPGKDGKDGFTRSIPNSIFVDINGDDNTGEKYNYNKPFKTLEKADEAALSADVIYVNAGRYEVTALKKSTNWVFSPGVLLVKTGAGAMFEPSESLHVNGASTIDANGGCILSIPENSNASVALKAESIINNSAGGFQVPLFHVQGGSNIDIFVSRISSGKQGVLKLNSTGFSTAHLHLKTLVMATGGTATSIDLGTHTMANISCDALLNPAGFSLITNGGDHTISFGSITGNVSLGSGSTLLNMNRMNGNLMCNAGTHVINGTSIRSMIPITLTGRLNCTLKLHEVVTNDTALSCTLDSEAVVDATISNIRNEGPNTVAIQINAMAGYTPGPLPELDLNVHNILADTICKIADNTRIAGVFKIAKALSTGGGIQVGKIEAISSLLFNFESAGSQKEFGIFESPATGYPSITLTGSYSSYAGSAILVTSVPLTLKNCALLDGLASIKTPLSVAPGLTLINCTMSKPMLPPFK
jgi:hypothetical protein